MLVDTEFGHHVCETCEKGGEGRLCSIKIVKHSSHKNFERKNNKHKIENEPVLY